MKQGLREKALIVKLWSIASIERSFVIKGQWMREVGAEGSSASRVPSSRRKLWPPSIVAIRKMPVIRCSREIVALERVIYRGQLGGIKPRALEGLE